MKIFSVVIILFIGIITNAQIYTLKGKVLDFHNHEALSNANIYKGKKKVATTNDKGEFTVSLLKGSHTLSITHDNCVPKKETIVLQKDIYINFFIEHHEKELEQIQLIGKTKYSTSSIVKSLSNNIIRQKSSENLGNILTEISGVNTLKTGNNISKPIIHGLYGSRIIIMNNGTRMAEQEWGIEHAPSIDTNAFESISILKGANALKFGSDAMGGVILLETKKFPSQDTLMGSIITTYNSNGRGGNIVTDIVKTWSNKWFIKSQGTYKKFGDFTTPNTSLQNTGTNEHSFSFEIGNRSTHRGVELFYNSVYQDLGIFSGAHLGNTKDFLQAINTGQIFYTGNFSYNINNPKQKVHHQLAKLSAYKRLENIGKISLMYSFQHNNRKEYDIRRGNYNKLPAMDITLTTHQIKLDNIHEHKLWKWETGINGSYQNNFPDPSTKTRRILPDYNRYEAGIYSSLDYQFEKKLRGEIAIRYDFNRYNAFKYYDTNDWNQRFADVFPQFFDSYSGSRVFVKPILNFHNISANIGLAYNFLDNIEVKFNISRASRTPNAAELFADGLHHSAGIIERGTLNIKNEIVHQGNLLIKTQIPQWLKGFRMEVNPYFLHSNSFINQIPTDTEITIRGIFPVWSFQQIKAKMYGVDIDSELKFSDAIKWNSKFSTVYGQDLTNAEPLILMPPTQFRNSLEIQFKKISLKMDNEIHLRQKHHPTRILYVDIIENGQNLQKEIDLTTPPKSYSIWNTSVEINLIKNLKLNANITNLFNTKYREYLNRLRYFSDALGRSYIFSLGYRF